MRKALVIGVNHYVHGSPLYGCVNDALSVANVLEKNEDGTANFAMRRLLGTGPTSLVTRTELKNQIRALFDDDLDIALLYFAGHGHIETTGGYLLASDSRDGDEGYPLADVLTHANNSRARNRIIILDSCHSGIAGARPSAAVVAELKEGTTILTSSTAEQYSNERAGHGVFSTLFVDALSGGASDVLGNVTPGAVYAHIDQSLGAWQQRPVFKTNVKNFVSMRKVRAPIAVSELLQIDQLFPSPGFDFRLDPSFEPRRSVGDSDLPPPDPDNTRKFAILQKYNRINLLVPVGAPHMWDAAMESKSCKLTTLGEHYRRLVEQKLIRS